MINSEVVYCVDFYIRHFKVKVEDKKLIFKGCCPQKLTFQAVGHKNSWVGIKCSQPTRQCMVIWSRAKILALLQIFGAKVWLCSKFLAPKFGSSPNIWCPIFGAEPNIWHSTRFLALRQITVRCLIYSRFSHHGKT